VRPDSAFASTGATDAGPVGRDCASGPVGLGPATPAVAEIDPTAATTVDPGAFVDLAPLLASPSARAFRSSVFISAARATAVPAGGRVSGFPFAPPRDRGSIAAVAAGSRARMPSGIAFEPVPSPTGAVAAAAPFESVRVTAR